MTSKQAAVDAEQTYQAGKIGSAIAKFAELGLNRVRQSMSEQLQREITLEEAADWLEKNIDELSFRDLDDIIATNLKVKLVINSSMHIASAILMHHDGWKDQLLRERETLLLDMARLYRYDIYEMFAERPKMLKFFTDYLIYTLRLQ